MGAPAKFLFDLDFSHPLGRGEATSAEIAARIAEAEARGARNGYAAGKADAATENAQRHAIALAQIADAVSVIGARVGDVQARMETEAVNVALAVGRKLSAALIAREPLVEIMALVTDCLHHLTTTPHLVVRINDALYDEARLRIEEIARQCGFEGRLVILAEPDIEGGDCRIEWADGGVASDRASTEAKIEELIGRYLATRGAEQ